MAGCQLQKSEILVINVFCDTTTLIYSHDNRDPDKQNQCVMWLRELASNDTYNAVINLQVLNELINVLIRKKWYSDVGEIFSIVEKLSILGSTPIKLSTMDIAKSILLATNYSWWDCLLLASAKELDCQYFLSEDMTDNHTVEGLTIINPFLHLPSEIV